MKKIIKNNKKYIIVFLILVVLFNVRLPYYICTTGGVIDITDRIDSVNRKDLSGSLNLLYVTELEGTIPTTLLSYVIKSWDLYPKEDRALKNETSKEVYERNRLMLKNSIQNATFVAYKHAGKTINIKDKRNLVLATTTDNNLSIGDIILKVDNKTVEDVNEIKSIITSKSEGDSISLLIKRDGKDMEVTTKVRENKKIGVVIITDYDYTLDPEIDIKFKEKESGSSGGLMLALSIYSAVSGEDITNGYNLAGTGTIDMDGNVGEIDGIKYKIMGAVKNDIDLILVPKENYKEAMEVKRENNYDIDIKMVRTFDEAINYLKSYNK